PAALSGGGAPAPRRPHRAACPRWNGAGGAGERSGAGTALRGDGQTGEGRAVPEAGPTLRAGDGTRPRCPFHRPTRAPACRSALRSSITKGTLESDDTSAVAS